jgi:hypothetical protein
LTPREVRYFRHPADIGQWGNVAEGEGFFGEKGGRHQHESRIFRAANAKLSAQLLSTVDFEVRLENVLRRKSRCRHARGY